MPRALTLLSVVLISVQSLAAQEADDAFKYEIDLTYYADDLFHVVGYPAPLTPADSIYRFVAFAPGVHQVLDFGRFVRSFRAFDEQGEEIETLQLGTNDWRITRPVDVHRIEYDVEDSFDADVPGNIIYPMSGTGIEPDYVAINTFGVIGYFADHRNAPVELTIHHNPAWKVGTALTKFEDGSYRAESYYHLADSPILLGNLSFASVKIGEIEVEAYVYTPVEELEADRILELAEGVLNAAYDFATFAPVDRYVFLMYFHDREAAERNTSIGSGGGALEHSYSSVYSLPAMPQFVDRLVSIMGHEFMHILTPLNLRSEIIANWDYTKPTSEDQHLWLYEGVTEWVAHIMELRSGLIDVDEYLKRMSDKITAADRMGRDYSLARLSGEWHTEEGRKAYGNIYQLGAVTANALDLELLRLSNGERGLRELYVSLVQKYGKDRPFDNDTFFDEIVEMTYPEIGTFIEGHIKKNEPFNFAQDFSLIGVNYTESRVSNDSTPVFGVNLQPANGRLVVSGIDESTPDFGLAVGDTILTVFGTEMNMHSYQHLNARKSSMQVGDTYEVTVKRGDSTLTLEGVLAQRWDRNVLEVDQNATDEQKRMRGIWSRHLDTPNR
jgi:predicted metalloprotease with PDZ domain